MKNKCFNQHTSAVLLSASLLLFTNACAQETTISAVEASAPVNASDAVAQHAQPQKSKLSEQKCQIPYLVLDVI